MYKYAIIVAGGAGIRMGTETPKQFLLLNGKPVLWHTIKAFADSYDDIEIILVLPAAHIQQGENLAKEFPLHKITITKGGETRFHSVKNGLQLIKKTSIIFVHDGVRCLLTRELIYRSYQTAEKNGSAIPALAGKDSVRLIENGESRAVDRTLVMLIQTPQTFLSDILLPAFEIEYETKFTDEASVVESSGHRISLIEGEEANIKITRPIDLYWQKPSLVINKGKLFFYLL